ncbi:Putative aliphatic sulfonates transport permease protein SsuC [Variovorax sp. PBS-H4]|uniref:ABC transporter permease n=1 Tax=Variovorax sp. PBS-H4 TaxID=434008 RepID=UPI001316DBF8|nr:ABC transporter permease [Variovorax sp. PBS-H4]VTU28094.1 Putative aliphatic sulfonates transport permease protein SsuC [Variovorax sp. PBS-H4]
MKVLARLSFALGGLVLLGLLWHAATASGLVPKIYLPTPRGAFDALHWGFTEGDLAHQAIETLMRMIWGWLLASLIAVLIGALLGVWEEGALYLNPLLEFVRPLPASAVVPVAIVFFGLTPGMVIGVVAFGSLWPTLLATVHGFASVDPRLKEVSRVLALGKLEYVLKIGLPNAVTDILGGMRVSMTIALILSIVGEMLSGQPGLGTAILLAGRSYQSADLFAGIALLGLIGLVTNALLQRCEAHLLRWRS